MAEDEITISEYEEKCKKILEEPEVRFSGLISGEGELLVGGFKNGINPRLTDEQKKSVYQELAVRVSKRKAFDKELGRVKYSASRREYEVIMSFPIFEKVILVVADPNCNIDRLAYKVIAFLGKQWYEFFGL